MHPTAGGIAVRLVSNYYQIILDIGLFLFFVIGAKVMVLFTIRVSRPRVLKISPHFMDGIRCLVASVWNIANIPVDSHVLFADTHKNSISS